jgi:putative ABC transport system permease protein
MSIRDLLVSTFRTLWAHKLRAFLTMFGIAWGIVSITLMVAAGEGLKVGQEKQVATLGKNLIIVWSGRTSMQAGGARAGCRLRWSYDDIPILRADSPDCLHVLPEWGVGGTSVRSKYNSASLLVTASDPAFPDLRSITVASGRFYNQQDVADSRRVAFLGSDAKRQLFADREPLGENVYVNGIPYAVIGVMRAKEQDSSYDGRDISKIFIPFTAAMRDIPPKPPLQPNDLDQLLVAPKSIEQHETCMNQVKASLARIHRFDPQDKEAVPNWDTVENNKRFQAMTDGMQYFLGAVGIVTLLLGGIGVMNVMLVAVRERTREIGVRKAVGSTSGAILAQFFLEAVIIVLFSGAVGLGIAYGLCAAVNTAEMPPFFAGLLPTWNVTLMALGVLGFVAVGSAVYPARQAARVDPIEALRFEAGG